MYCRRNSRVHALTAILVLSFAALIMPSLAQGEGQNVGAPQQSYDNNIQDLYELLLQHDALDSGHQLARKSVRSPSRRLRFGRRSDPGMPTLSFERTIQEPELDIHDEEFIPQKHIRAPVRLRFGRRSLEQAVPHIFPMQEPQIQNELYIRKDTRAPSMRLRFGRRSDPSLQFPNDMPMKDLKFSASAEERESAE